MRNGINFMKKKNKKIKNKFDRKDLLYSILLGVSFVVFVAIVVRFKYYYGSTLDWESQHSVIPEYFRMLFYKTHDLLPDFAFNLGNGQNIYNFSYYGLLSPIILLSYLLPFVKMIDYVVLSSIVSVIASAILFYYWLRRKKDASYLGAFLASFALMFATSLSFHSHRHVMFMNYMPFMIMGLFGVDKKLNFGKGWLLSLSVFLMVMTSFYYSVGGIIALVIYGIYEWIRKTEKPSVKKFFVEGFKFLLPIIIGIAMAAIILLPTFHVILSSRGETFNTITWRDLIIPGVNIEYMLYNTYGVGLTSILILAIINLLFKKRENLFLGVILASLIIFPILNYLLNATMYIDAKALIPLLPLAVYAIYIFIRDLFERKIDLKKIYVITILVTLLVILRGNLVNYFLIDLGLLSGFIFLYWRLNKKVLLAIPILVIPLVTSLGTSLNDQLVTYNRVQELRGEFKDVLSSITDNDKSMYRISNAKTVLRDVNNLYGNIDYYTSTLYSSTYNMNYNKFYYDVINNPIQNRNRVITSPTANILFLMLSSNKYLIDNQANYFGYKLYKTVDGDKVYKNDDVFPMMYARSDIISLDDFKKLSYPDKSVALLKGVVVDDESTIEYISNLKKFEFESSRFNYENLNITKENGDYIIIADGNSKASYKLPEEYQNKIVFVRFKMKESASCSEDDTSVTIDGVKNKLTCKSWKYHNQNYDFDYVLPNKDKTAYKVAFSPGRYRISDIELYAMDYDEIKDEHSKVDEFNFDTDKTKGDYIVGDIDVSKDGYFVTSIPYDEGFHIEVDGKMVDYVKVDEGFVGFKIGAGHHQVKIEYRAPWKNYATVISGIGILSFAICTILERKRTTL